MPLYDQVELLCQAITSQAKAEVDQILARAREEADRRLSEAEASRQEALARTKAEVEAQANSRPGTALTGPNWRASGESPRPKKPG